MLRKGVFFITENYYMPKKTKLQKLGDGIYPRHQTYWLAFTPFSGGGQKHVSLGTADPTLARAKAKAIRKNPHLAVCGTWEEEMEALREYNREYSSHSEFTLNNYAYALGLFFSVIKKPIPEVGDAEIREFFDRLKVQGFSTRTPNVIPSDSTQLSYWTRLQGFFNWLLSQNKIRENYFVGPEWPTHHRKRLQPGQWLEKEDIRILFSAIRPDGQQIELDPEIEFVMYCGFHAGMRKNEITNCTPDWFRLSKDVINIPGRQVVNGIPFMSKTGHDRNTPLTEEFKEFLTKRFLFKPGQHFCIANDSNGERRQVRRRGKGRSKELPAPRYRYDFRYKFKRYIREMGYPYLTAHGMRHSFVTACLQANITLTKVSSYIGDREATVEDVYSHLIPRTGELKGVF